MESGWRHLINSFWRQPVASLSKSSVPLYWWFRSPVGSRILAQERELIDQCRKHYGGRFMAQVSGAGVSLLGKPNNRQLKVAMYPSRPGKTSKKLAEYSWLVSELDQVPLETDSVDFLVLHHALEFSEDPHAVLREASRILSPQGHMLLIVFNPYSLFGLRKSMQLIVRKTIPWAHHSLSRGRVADWLRLMNCEPLNVAFGFYSFPLQSNRLLKYSHKLDSVLSRWGLAGGAFYVVHASKNVAGWVGSVEAQPSRAHLIQFPQVAATKNYKQID